MVGRSQAFENHLGPANIPLDRLQATLPSFCAGWHESNYFIRRQAPMVVRKQYSDEIDL
jgi:hypothetical protein